MSKDRISDILGDQWPEHLRGDEFTPKPSPNGHGFPETGAQAIIRCFHEVQPLPIEWLWKPWIPLGTLTVLDGDPGLAKSTLTLDWAARLSRGWKMPPEGGPRAVQPAATLLLSAEDDPERTIRPRLDAAGADVRRVHFLDHIVEEGEKRPPSLPWDLELVRGRVLDLGVRLVIIDPFTAFLGEGYDAHKDQDIRRCLARLAEMAKELRFSILLIRHLNKLGHGPALYRGGGSIGITGAARASLVVGRDPDNERVRVLAMNKSNLGPIPRSLAYVLEPVPDTEVTRIGWQGETDLKAADILWHDQGLSQSKAGEDMAEARRFLARILASGPTQARDVFKQAKEAGISEITVRRAKKDLKVQSVRYGTSWAWKLPGVQGDQVQDDHDHTPNDHDHLEDHLEFEVPNWQEDDR